MPYANLILTCEICEQPFKAHRPTQRFCSAACRATTQRKVSSIPCLAEGCEGGATVRGWCDLHYRRWLRSGDAKGWRNNPERRFWESVEKTEGCWLWRGAVSGTGYGRIKDDKQLFAVHRFAYELLVGDIPVGLEIDHLCRVRNCVNPDHLEAVTRQVNVQRAAPYRRYKAPPFPACSVCGKTLSKRTAKRCQEHADHSRRKKT